MPPRYTIEEQERFAPNDEYLPRLLAAEERGDEAEAHRWRQKLIVPLDYLEFLKEHAGADFIRSEGLNISEATRVYGPDWLDQ